MGKAIDILLEVGGDFIIVKFIRVLKNITILNTFSFLKFGLVGCINTIVSIAIYYILVYFKVDYVVATIIGYLGSSIFGYILNRIWVFKTQNSKLMNSLFRYFVVYSTSLLINVLCMYLWIDVLSISQYIAPILTICITLPYNYFLSKLWAFKEHSYK